MLAPVVLFVFNRPCHTLNTIQSLKSNDLAGETDLYVYADGARNATDIENVNAVREIVKNAAGFKSVTIIERDINIGLAKSIISGVSEVIAKRGRVIVLEDDLSLSQYFLRYMNDALNRYDADKKVFHISGWNYPIGVSENHDDAFFLGVMNCWGWATWIDRWSEFSKDKLGIYHKYKKDRKWINGFNLNGANDFWKQVVANANGELNTWAIYWYVTIYERDGLCLNPAKTLVNNTGYDGSGVHCGQHDIYKSIVSNSPVCKWPETVAINYELSKNIEIFYRKSKKPILQRVASKLHKIIFK